MKAETYRLVQDRSNQRPNETMIFPIDPEVIYSRLRTHLDKAGERAGVRITSHDLRLTRMTQLHNSGKMTVR